MKPYLNVNLFSSNDQFCACNLDEYFLYPVLKENKDSKKQMAYALQGFLEYHKKKPYMERKTNDEINYYTGQAYQKNWLSIYDVLWKINVPHSEDMNEKILEEIHDKFIEPMSRLLDEMGIEYQFLS